MLAWKHRLRMKGAPLTQPLLVQGVDVLDKEKVWRAGDGRIGVLPGRLKDEEIKALRQQVKDGQKITERLSKSEPSVMQAKQI